MTQRDTTLSYETPTERPHKRRMKLIKRGKVIDPLLYDLLVRATPHEHEEWLNEIMLPFFKGVGINPKKQIFQDKEKNLLVKIGKNSEHQTIFSAHRDTVHRHKKKIRLLHQNEMVYADAEDTDTGYYGPSILGADDKVGCYIMCRMIERKIPGFYLFHSGEERGGIGSRFFVNTYEEELSIFKRCVAFDRKGYQDVITKQRGSVCCSNDFADDLAEQLNISLPEPIHFEKCTGGVFTDSANYTKIVPECTNLSVGYFSQHSKTECFDNVWLETIFLPAVFKVNWQILPTVRDPKEKKPVHSYHGDCYRGFGGRNRPAQQYAGQAGYQGALGEDSGVYGEYGIYGDSYDDFGDTVNPLLLPGPGGSEQTTDAEKKENEKKLKEKKRNADNVKEGGKIILIPSEVTFASDLDQLPPYELSDGLLSGVTDNSMAALISLTYKKRGIYRMAREVHTLLKTMDAQQLKYFKTAEQALLSEGMAEELSRQNEALMIDIKAQSHILQAVVEKHGIKTIRQAVDIAKRKQLQIENTNG